ncbi:hypothetical protein [Proteiniphilum sp.]|uniref:OmpP1/FadL family transporter n=1 Tax=Proteiniphilum sp. TaxID=1926877 RepID=UPI002B200FB9|nr:hypothetical protein [Proteiniphilum sp.]MEA4918366.1 hypothetical protein [Proteiniphilum sp.]
MKKITYILFSLILSAPLFAQSEIDALRFSQEDIQGTARAMSMGGAFGALGGDQTGVSINPAGIAVYRSSEVMGTLNLSREKSTVGSAGINKSRVGMDNLGFVGYFPLRNDIMPLINFGFSYNKLKSFDKDVSASGTPRNTMIQYIAHQSDGVDLKFLEKTDDFDPFTTEYWLSALGYNAYLINPVKEGDRYRYVPVNTNGTTPYSGIRTYENGYIDNYDFTIGTTVNNVLNLGLSLSIKDIYYDLATDYLEDFDDKGGYTMTNWLNVRGAGVGAKFGAIYKPIHALRIGLAWHTPTWYALTEKYEAQIHDVMDAFVDDPNYKSDIRNSGSYPSSYDLKTPGKIVASVATVLGNSFIASLDYELVNYSNMKLKLPSNSTDDPSWYDLDNKVISQHHKMASTVKAGIEYRFTPQFSGRLGYAWMQNPYDADVVEFGDAVVAGTNTIYRMEGDSNYFTGGVGYRFNRNFYLDMALVYKTRNDDLYPFPNVYEGDRLVIDAAPFSLKSNSVRGLLTLGYRF